MKLEVQEENELNVLKETMNNLIAGLYYVIPQEDSEITFRLDVAELEKSLNVDISTKDIDSDFKPYITNVVSESGVFKALIVNASEDFMSVLQDYINKYIKSEKIQLINK